MRTKIDHEIEETEKKARLHIAEIIPLLSEIPAEEMGPVETILELALETAKRRAEKSRSEKEKEASG